MDQPQKPRSRDANNPNDLQKRYNLVLLFRIENTELISRHCGPSALPHLTCRLGNIISKHLKAGEKVSNLAPDQLQINMVNRSLDDAERLAHRLHSACQKPVLLGGKTLTPVITGALVEPPSDRFTPHEAITSMGLIQLAASGRDDLGCIRRIELSDLSHNHRIRPTLQHAIRAGEIDAHFQPQFCTDTGKVVGFEALARWHSPTEGLLLPGRFLPHATEDDQLLLTQIMVQKALVALRHWERLGWNSLSVSINITEADLLDPAFADLLLWELDRQEVAPQRLVLEVLESVGPGNMNTDARNNLKRLSQAGCRFELDDFGTGYASLDAIRTFGAHRIKIDRSFVVNCDHDHDQQRMIAAILSLAHHLQLSVLAEGIETEAEREFLIRVGCEQIQGFVLGRPMPLTACNMFLDEISANQKSAFRKRA